jgi:putative CocE/NonD family hydrolase
MKGKVFRRFSLVFLVLVLGALVSGCTRIVSRVLQIDPGEPTLMKVERNVMVPMRDGVRLATDIYRPRKEGRYPVILSRIPYGTDSEIYYYLAKYFVRNGYIVLLQDCRGIQNSEGIWFPLVYEMDDGRDTTEWIKDQPWYDGNLGMIGGSYFGYTQWEAAVANPEIKAMVPIFTSGDIRRIIINGGALEFIMVEGWLTGMEAQTTEQNLDPDWAEGFYNYPLRPAIRYDLEEGKSHPEDFDPMALLDHPGDTDLELPMNFNTLYKTVSAPSLLIAGWFDQFEQPQLDDFTRIRQEGIGNARKTRLIVGPWTHGKPMSPHEGKLASTHFFIKETLDWLDYWLKGVDNGVAEEAPVKIFIMGENIWRDEQEWPLARTQYTPYYIHSNGNANTDYGHGVLSLEKPGNEPPDKFKYDPKDPMPTIGGTFQPFTGVPAGSFDQRELLHRPDLLIYQTEPLKEGVEVTGPISVILYASSSARDTDFTAMLLDVHPDGKAMYIQDGCIRARYRDGYQNPSLIEPGKVYKYTIDLWSTSNYFAPGHRIMLEITSSNFPQYDRNTNAGGEGGKDNIITAEQTVFHTAEYPTHITLPVIPR